MAQRTIIAGDQDDRFFTQFTKQAKLYKEATVTVIANGKKVNGKSLLDFMALDIAPGTTVTIQVEGDHAETCVANLAKSWEK